jgi:hypothetical protein
MQRRRGAQSLAEQEPWEETGGRGEEILWRWIVGAHPF